MTGTDRDHHLKQTAGALFVQALAILLCAWFAGAARADVFDLSMPRQLSSGISSATGTAGDDTTNLAAGTYNAGHAFLANAVDPGGHGDKARLWLDGRLVDGDGSIRLGGGMRVTHGNSRSRDGVLSSLPVDRFGEPKSG